MTLPARFWVKVDKSGPVPEHRPELGPCWIWTAATDINGYGVWGIGSAKDGTRGLQKVHRAAYEDAVGAIEDGLEPDHLCRVPACCNPAHIEPVTHRENILRGRAPGALRELYASRTHCDRGHPLTGYNVRTIVRNGHVNRICRSCRREWQQRYRASTAKGERP